MALVLFHLTGDERWLEPPYRPTRPSGLDPHDRGGYSPETACEIVDAAHDAFVRWRGGAPPAIPQPDDELFQRLMAFGTGEPVPIEYARMMAVELGFRPRPALPDPGIAPPSARDACFLVVGAGISGLAVAQLLREAGIRFRLIEKNATLGGTWHENVYPGAGVDTPSYLYSFSDHLHDWSHHFAKRDEIQGYIEEFAKERGLVDLIEFDTELVRADLDEARGTWSVELESDAGTERAEVTGIITASGFLNRPKLPDLPGMADFRGELFHSARWPEELDLDGRRVAVVGSGASAVQIVPAIAEQVDQVTVFQRTPQWIAPTTQYFEEVPTSVHWMMRNVPYYHAWYRFRLAWTFMDRLHGSWQIDPRWQGVQRAINPRNDAHRRHFEAHIQQQMTGREALLPHVVPSYPPFAKRMLLDTGWYAALKRDNVRLVPAEVDRFTATGIEAGGSSYADFDVVVMCTGFEAQRPLFPMEIRGRDGASLRETWHDTDARAHLGITVPGFPNLFMMYGPNTNPGGGSYIMIAELQARYIVRLIGEMLARGIELLEPRHEPFTAYNDALDRAHEAMIWSHPGVETYYRNTRGRVVTNMPWRVVDYWQMLQDIHLGDYQDAAAAAQEVRDV